MTTIYEKCWKKEKCIRVLGRRACASAEACIRIFEENGRYKIGFKVGGKSIEYDLLDVCYPAYEVGIARLNVCTREIRIVGGRLRSVKLTAELCIGTKVLGRRLEKCWTLIRTTVPFAYMTVADLKKSFGKQYGLDAAFSGLAPADDQIVAVALDDEDDSVGVRLLAGGARVINNYPDAVMCWTGEPTPSTDNKKFFTVPGNGGVSPDDVDVDHVKDPTGQWWKCGEDLLGRRTVFVERNGVVREAECKTTGENKPCGQ